MRKILCVFALCLMALPCFAATVYVDEFQYNPTVTYQAAITPEVTHQTVAITGSSVQSNAFNSATRLIRVHADAICSIQIGSTNPTATTTSARFVAGQTEYFLVNPGDKLAVITNT